MAREAAKEAAQTAGTPAPGTEPAVAKPEVVVFTVKAKFGGSKSQESPAPAPNSQVAMKK